MPSNVSLTEEEEEFFENGGGLKKETLRDRKLHACSFYEYFKKQTDQKIDDLEKNDEGREKISKIFSNYFWSMWVAGGSRPKTLYASKIRSHIRMQIMEDFKVDVMDVTKSML